MAAGVTPAEGGERLALFVHRAHELVTRPPVTCAGTASASAIARTLSAERVGSVVVVDDDGAPVGIVTDRDLRRNVVAAGRDPSATPARAIMSAPLVTLPPDAFAFDVVLAMTRHGIHHVVLVDGKRLAGVVSARDVMALSATHPVALARDIERAPSVAVLGTVAHRVVALVRRLLDEGVGAHGIAQVVAELNDRLVVRVLTLVTDTLARAGSPPPATPYCWLLFGSEARREQTLRTDQDNGLVYADAPAEAGATAAAYYARFARDVIEALVAVGFPRCPGDVMASNPRWCQPLSVWSGYFRAWMEHPAPAELLAASIHFDVRGLAGDPGLGAALVGIVTGEAPARPLFLRLLAHEVVSRRPPLTLFRNVAVESSGPRRGLVDVKAAGMLQLTGAARVMALAHGVQATNTIERFRAAGPRIGASETDVRDTIDAYTHLMRLRLVHQIEQLAEGRAPDNHVDPTRLSRADALLFRDALRTVQRVQARIRDRFVTDLVG
ncbi:MAG TPA: DUF294 nucleotidyltransferase-like domain-containing protein [Candidatus Tectomicrobia bacterium]|nr:DUF294 nucleotidyltransferase-like domain-containing protein [Candidatus Tectomicrobia bacterium]